MSNLPLAFSAAHVSKWDTLPNETFVLKRTMGVSVDNQPSIPDHDFCRPGATTREGDVTGSTLGASDAAVIVEAPKSHENMTVKTHTWITLWFLLSMPVVLWDVGYCFFRPRSMVGGDLHWIWEPYGIYQNIDYVYGIKAFEENSGFTNAQALLNLVETTLNVVYVYLTHVSRWPGAPVIGFASATMTLSKTLLYLAQEYYCGWCSVGHNSFSDLAFLYLLPNGFWVVFPSMVVWRLGCDIIGPLTQASALQHVPGTASKKSE